MSKKRLKVLLLFEASPPKLSDDGYERLMETDEDWYPLNAGSLGDLT